MHRVDSCSLVGRGKIFVNNPPILFNLILITASLLRGFPCMLYILTVRSGAEKDDIEIVNIFMFINFSSFVFWSFVSC